MVEEEEEEDHDGEGEFQNQHERNGENCQEKMKQERRKDQKLQWEVWMT
jgi:hypothetical protein